MLEPLLDDYDLEELGIKSRSTAQKDRVAGRGIPFVKIGRLVRYRPADVEKYLSELPTLRSTSEADAAALGTAVQARESRRRASPDPDKTAAQPASRRTRRRAREPRDRGRR